MRLTRNASRPGEGPAIALYLRRNPKVYAEMKRVYERPDLLERWPGAPAWATCIVDSDNLPGFMPSSVKAPDPPPISASWGDGCLVKPWTPPICFRLIRIPGNRFQSALLNNTGAIRHQGSYWCVSGRLDGGDYWNPVTIYCEAARLSRGQ